MNESRFTDDELDDTAEDENFGDSAIQDGDDDIVQDPDEENQTEDSEE